jgi:hypothetical protein
VLSLFRVYHFQRWVLETESGCSHWRRALGASPLRARLNSRVHVAPAGVSGVRSLDDSVVDPSYPVGPSVTLDSCVCRTQAAGRAGQSTTRPRTNLPRSQRLHAGPAIKRPKSSTPIHRPSCLVFVVNLRAIAPHVATVPLLGAPPAPLPHGRQTTSLRQPAPPSYFSPFPRPPRSPPRHPFPRINARDAGTLGSSGCSACALLWELAGGKTGLESSSNRRV